jgi:GNAT superfamily N-acetyltransferase
VRVRPAAVDDTNSIAEVYLASHRGLDFLPRLHTDDDIRRFVREVVVPGHEVWVADDDDRVVGFAALSDDMLMWIYVHPDAQRRGAGTALLDKAKERRPSGFRLWTFQRNTGARRFYERYGLHAVETTDGSGNEEREPDVLYAWVPAGDSSRD